MTDIEDRFLLSCNFMYGGVCMDKQDQKKALMESLHKRLSVLGYRKTHQDNTFVNHLN